VRRLAAALMLCACARGGGGAREYQGVIELHERVLSFEVSGRVLELRVRRGEQVAAAQVLAVLDDSLERPLREAKAAEAQAADAQLELLRAGARAGCAPRAPFRLRSSKRCRASTTARWRSGRRRRSGCWR
jgi:multidrug efflux pump subunit AcrA (membrane-fusion protein)